MPLGGAALFLFGVNAVSLICPAKGCITQPFIPVPFVKFAHPQVIKNTANRYFPSPGKPLAGK